MTPAQTDTPRTEKAFDDWNPHDGSLDEIWDHARQLERELSQAVKVAGEALKLCIEALEPSDTLRHICPEFPGLDAARSALSELQRITGGEG